VTDTNSTGSIIPRGKLNGIGVLGESSLHASLIAWYAQAGDLFEVPVDGYLIDILRGDLLIEVQTRRFAAIKSKLSHLLINQNVRLVYPLPYEKWIVRLPAEGKAAIRRKSPLHGGFENLFRELIRFPQLIAHPNFSLEILRTREEECWREDGKGSWRRKGWSIADRRLLEVIDSLVLADPQDFLRFIPPDISASFTNQELALALKKPAKLAQKMTYCLKAMGVLEQTGRRGRSNLYTIREAID
jgi:hypothetical protein